MKTELLSLSQNPTPLFNYTNNYKKNFYVQVKYVYTGMKRIAIQFFDIFSFILSKEHKKS